MISPQVLSPSGCRQPGASSQAPGHSAVRVQPCPPRVTVAVGLLGGIGAKLTLAEMHKSTRLSRYRTFPHLSTKGKMDLVDVQLHFLNGSLRPSCGFEGKYRTNATPYSPAGRQRPKWRAVLPSVLFNCLLRLSSFSPTHFQTGAQAQPLVPKRAFMMSHVTEKLLLWPKLRSPAMTPDSRCRKIARLNP